MRPTAAKMQPRWDDLQDFLRVARAGQIARAAAAAGVDATTLARHLRRLEAALGQTLFEQAREGQVLTAAGEALLVAVEAMGQAAAGIDRPMPIPIACRACCGSACRKGSAPG